MSKMVVGMNSRPAIRPQRIDCGLRKTVRMALAALPQPVASAVRLVRPRDEREQQRADREAGDSHDDQKRLQGTPEAITGPTTNWPAEPPAMPNICVAPISVAARDAGKFLVAM